MESQNVPHPLLIGRHGAPVVELEVIVLVEKGGVTPREVDDAQGLGRQETAAVFGDLVRRGLLDSEGRRHPLGALPMPWRFASTTFHLTPMARSLRQDEDFSLKAFAASLGVFDDDSLDNPSIGL